MKNACLIKAHHAGLFSLVNNVIMWMHEYQRVAVDWSECIYGPKTWEALFEPLPPLPEGDVDSVGVHPEQWLTYRNAGGLYMTGGLWRTRCRELWNKLIVRQEILNWVNIFRTSSLPPVGFQTCAVLVRAHTHAGEQLSERSQTLEEYAREIENEIRRGGAHCVYVAAGDEESLAWFKARFPVQYHPRTKRSSSRNIDRHLNEKQDENDAMNCLEEVLLMSRCDALIHGISNMATAALYISPSMRSIYIP